MSTGNGTNSLLLKVEAFRITVAHCVGNRYGPDWSFEFGPSRSGALFIRPDKGMGDTIAKVGDWLVHINGEVLVMTQDEMDNHRFVIQNRHGEILI